MASGAQGHDPVVGSAVPRQKGRATLETLSIGCIAMVQKDGQARRAEILSIKETKSGKQFYCNFDNYNKRLDEWVPAARIDFAQDVEWPNPEKEKEKKEAKKSAPSKSTKNVSKKAQKRPTTQAQTREGSLASEGSPSRRRCPDSTTPTNRTALTRSSSRRSFSRSQFAQRPRL